MALARHAVGQHARPRQVGLVVPQAMRQRAKGARHGRGIDDGQHRHAKVPRQVGGTGLAIEQAHHAFDKDQVGLLRRGVQAGSAVPGAIDPQIEQWTGAPLASWCQCGSRKSART